MSTAEWLGLVDVVKGLKKKLDEQEEKDLIMVPKQQWDGLNAKVAELTSQVEALKGAS